MKRNQERPGVMMYFHLLEPMRALSREQFADMIWAMLDYAQYGALPQFEDPLMAMSWGYLRHAADVDQQRYEERCAQARAASAKRWGKNADGCERMRTVPKYNTETDSESEADADAYTTASASAEAKAEAASEAESNTDTEPNREGVPPAAEMEPLETPLAMANSPSWAKMVEASRHRMGTEAFEAWREAQIEAITIQNEALRAEARANKKAAG